jgi:UDP-N-acetylmuramoyl-L-alanyl-D-glutamate--2,6-diaminopimelate ligase
MQGRVSAELADFSVFTTEDPRFEDAASIIDEIAAGAIAAGARDTRDFVKIVDRRAAIDHAIGLARPGDAIVLAGKGHERSIIWGLEKRPWDEAAVARELLRARGYGRS